MSRRAELRKCDRCGCEFHPHTGRPSNKWCSDKCYHQSRRINTSCVVCGKEFYYIASRKNPKKYCSRKCYAASEEHPANFKGEKHITKRGYVYVYCPEHPSVQGNPYKRVAEHRLVMEKFLGRELHLWEVIHHKNGEKGDNQIENLELWVKRGHPGGSRVDIVYAKEISTLRAENTELRQRIAQLDFKLASFKEAEV